LKSTPPSPSLSSLLDVLGSGAELAGTRLMGEGPAGQLPLSAESLLHKPSGALFGMTQSAGMGWNPAELGRPHYLILSTQGGLRDPDGTPVALGYHTGHWEIGLLVRAAAEELRRLEGIPFAASVSDPCDGRSQGTTAMFDSLPYRNDAALTMRRLIRSLPERRGVMGIATCDKGLPAMLLALAGAREQPIIVVPGGVTLPARGAEDAGTVQSLGARYAHAWSASNTPRTWAAARVVHRAVAASFWEPQPRLRSWPRRWDSACRTAPSVPRVSQCGSTWLGALHGPS